MKRAISIIVCAVLVLSLAGCHGLLKLYAGKRPIDQPGYSWISEDGNIIIKVDENWKGTGVLYVGDDPVDFEYIHGPTTDMYIYLPDCRNSEGAIMPEYRLETWIGYFKSETEFIATVEETTFFTVGEKITFYRVDKEVE